MKLRPSTCLLLAALTSVAACEQIAGIRDVTKGAGGTGTTGSTGTTASSGGAGGKGGAGPSCVPTAPLNLPGDCSALFPDETKVLTIAEGLKDIYSCVDIGWLGTLGDPNVYAPTGPIHIPEDDPNTLLVVRGMATAEGELYRVPLLRDQACHVAGIGSPEKIAGVDTVSGFTRDPSGALLFARANSPSLEQEPIVAGLARLKPGSTALDETLDLTVPPFDVDLPLSGIGFIPNGFPGAGKLVFTTSRTDFVSPPVSNWFSVQLAGDGTGPLAGEVQGVIEETKLDGPASFAFLRGGSFGFPTNTILVSDYRRRSIIAHTPTPTGAPDPQTARIIVEIPNDAGISQTDVGPWGIALDPVSGDLLIVLYDFRELVAIRGFSP